jgi:hypothetical protein
MHVLAKANFNSSNNIARQRADACKEWQKQNTAFAKKGIGWF